MKTLSALHLSDLQFGNTNSVFSLGGHKTCVDRIVETLVNDDLSPEVVIVSGDLAERGKSEEFESAFAFLRDLHNTIAERFNQTPSWCIVPGNHDVDRAASRKHESDVESERHEAILHNFNTLIDSLKDSGLKVWSPRDIQAGNICRILTGEIEVLLVPLDSCEREGHRDDCHYGHITPQQIEKARRALKLHVHPWSFQIAVFHHSVVINAPDRSAFQDHLSRVLTNHIADPNERAGLVHRLSSPVVNRLDNAEEVLERLVELGFQLVLHGHQHYDMPIHLQLPRAEDDPFGHEGLTIMSAGSLGIGSGPDQPSVTSFQFYKIAKEEFTWTIESKRIAFQSVGRRSPHIDVIPERSIQWHCFSSRPRKIISGVCRVLQCVPKATVSNALTRMAPIDESLAWGHCFCKENPFQIGIGSEQITCRTLIKSIEANEASGLLKGLADVMRKQKAYADLKHWGLVDAQYVGENLNLTLGPTHYLPYVIRNTLIWEEEFTSLRNMAQSKSQDSESWPGLKNFLEWANQNISTRLTLQVIVEVLDQEGTPFVLLRRRSKNVTHGVGTIQFTVGGGFKCPLVVEDDKPELGKDFIDRGKGWIGRAFSRETVFESGIRISPEDFRIVALSVSKSDFSPLLTAVVRTTVEDSGIRSETKKVPLTAPDGVGLDSEHIWLPTDPPRDWWEGTHLIKIELGQSLIDTEKGKTLQAWRNLESVWNLWAGMDLPPASSISTVLRALQST